MGSCDVSKNLILDSNTHARCKRRFVGRMIRGTVMSWARNQSRDISRSLGKRNRLDERRVTIYNFLDTFNQGTEDYFRIIYTAVYRSRALESGILFCLNKRVNSEVSDSESVSSKALLKI